MAARKGHKKSGGRQKGTPNKVVPEIRTLARQYGPEAIEKLVRLMRGRDEALDRLEAKVEKVPGDSDEMRNVLRELLALLSGRNLQNELGATRELIDRGWGKPAQPFTGADGEGPAIVEIRRIIVPAKANGADPGHPDSGGVPVPTRAIPV